MKLSVEFLDHDILQSPADNILIPVNCVGVCGAGLAADWFESFPVSCRTYKAACGRGELEMGGLPYPASCWDSSTIRRFWAFPTKRHWKDQSDPLAIRESLLKLKAVLSTHSDALTLAIPPLGCGLGGLKYYDQVLPLIIAVFADWPAKLYLYLPR